MVSGRNSGSSRQDPRVEPGRSGTSRLPQVASGGCVLSDPRRGAEELPMHQRRMQVLDTPLGHTEFIKAQLEMLTAEHQTLLDRIPLIEDVQSGWSILVHCAAARANYVASTLRSCVPQLMHNEASRESLGARPLPREPDDFKPGCVRQGWQHEASSRVEQQFRQSCSEGSPFRCKL